MVDGIHHELKSITQTLWSEVGVEGAYPDSMALSVYNTVFGKFKTIVSETQAKGFQTHQKHLDLVKVSINDPDTGQVVEVPFI